MQKYTGATLQLLRPVRNLSKIGFLLNEFSAPEKSLLLTDLVMIDNRVEFWRSAFHERCRNESPFDTIYIYNLTDIIRNQDNSGKRIDSARRYYSEIYKSTLREFINYADINEFYNYLNRGLIASDSEDDVFRCMRWSVMLFENAREFKSGRKY